MADFKSPILLLVEDDSAVQFVLDTALSDEGFEVVTANNGKEAIAELDSDSTRFKVLITDIRLGAGPNGWEVGKHARELASNIPVIYMSGDSGCEWSANGVPGSLMLAKPFVVAQLVTAVSTLLNNAGSAMAPSDAMTADAGKEPSRG